MRSNSLWWRAAVCALGILGLSACSDRTVAINTVELSVAERANRDTPVAVDLVLVGDKDLFPQILALSAAEWFAGRDQWLRDHSSDLQVFSWELVPGQTLPRDRLSGKRDEHFGALVFANYLTPGPHRVRVEQPDITIFLGEEGVTVD